MKISSSLKLALAFFVFAGLYIVFSDRLTLLLVRGDIERHNAIQTYKGIGFVLVSSCLIYLFANRFNRNLLKAHKEQEEALARYNVLGMATNDGIWDLNLETGQCFTNRSLQEMFKYEESELSLNQVWWTSNLHPDDKSRVMESMQSALNRGDIVWKDEYRFRCKDGTYRAVLDRGYIMRDPSGSPFRLIGAMQDVTEQRSLQSQLVDEKIRHKNEMANSVINAHEEERKKLSDELHDNITQTLSVVKLYVENAKGDPHREEELLQKSLTYLVQVINELRMISRALIPPILRDIGLVVAVHDMIRQLEVSASVNIGLEENAFDENLIPEEKKLLLYRAIQESLQLATRYAGATVINIHLSSVDGQVRATIHDNGRGFDANHKHSVNTLRTIRNRLESVTGNLEVELTQAKGNKLTLQFGV